MRWDFMQYKHGETVYQALPLHHSSLYLYTPLHRQSAPIYTCNLILRTSQEPGQKYSLFDVSPEHEQTQKVCLCMEISHVSLLPLLTLD